jgi:hypothetical protein
MSDQEEYASSIIHAGGVSLATPICKVNEAQNEVCATSAGVMRSRLPCCCGEALELVADVLKIAGIDVGGEYLVDDGQEVGERSYYRQWCSIIRTDKPAHSRKRQCVFGSDE